MPYDNPVNLGTRLVSNLVTSYQPNIVYYSGGLNQSPILDMQGGVSFTLQLSIQPLGGSGGESGTVDVVIEWIDPSTNTALNNKIYRINAAQSGLGITTVITDTVQAGAMAITVQNYKGLLTAPLVEDVLLLVSSQPVTAPRMWDGLNGFGVSEVPAGTIFSNLSGTLAANAVFGPWCGSITTGYAAARIGATAAMTVVLGFGIDQQINWNYALAANQVLFIPSIPLQAAPLSVQVNNGATAGARFFVSAWTLPN